MHRCPCEGVAALDAVLVSLPHPVEPVAAAAANCESCDHAGAMQWTVVMPMSELARAKSRLVSASRDNLQHRALVTAMRADAIHACLAARSVARVIIVTDDADLVRHMNAPGSRWTRGGWYEGMKMDPRLDTVFSTKDEKLHAELKAKEAGGVSNAHLLKTLHWLTYLVQWSRH